MSTEMQELTNSPTLWLITVGAIALVWLLAYYCIMKSRRAAKQLGIPDNTVHMTLKTSVISAVGPSIVIATGMISLLVVMGGPTALMRLSVCGNVGYELQSVGIAAQVFGADGTAASMTPQIFQTAIFITAFGCIGYLVVPTVLVTKFDAITQKLGGSDGTMNTVVSAAAILGCYAYVDAPYLLRLDGSTSALITGFIAMYVINKVNQKVNKKWLSEWGLFFSMVLGMCAGGLTP